MGVRRAGLAAALSSAATFGTSGSFAGSLLAVGWTPGAAVTARILLAALVLTVPAVLALRGRWRQVRAQAGPLAVYGIGAVAGAQLCFFSAVQHLSVAVALLLEYSGVLLVVGWEWATHGRRPRPLTIGGAALAAGGLALLLDLFGGAAVDPVGVLWGLGAAVGLATFFVMSSDAEALPPLATAWAGLMVGGLALLAAAGLGALPIVAPRTAVVLLHTRVSWLVPVLALAVVAAAVAYVLGILGARLLGAKLAAFVGLTEVIFAAGFAWLLLGQLLGPAQLGGGLLVVAGVALVQLDEPVRPEAAPSAV